MSAPSRDRQGAIRPLAHARGSEWPPRTGSQQLTEAARGTPERLSFRPGPVMLGIGGAMTAVALLGFVWNGASGLILFVLTVTAWLAILDWRELRRTLPQLSVRRDIPVTVGRGAPFRVALHIRNASARAVSGAVRDVLPAAAEPEYWLQNVRIPAGGEQTLELQVRVPARGLHAFGPVWLRLRGRFGVLEGQRSCVCSAAVKVVPDTAVSDEAFYKTAKDAMRLLDQLTRTRLRGAGTEFECLAEFRDGDDPRRIDWHSSARLQRLVSRQYQVERHRDVMIVVDCGRLMGSASRPDTPVGPGRDKSVPPTTGGTKLDCAVDSALMLSRVALRKGDRCGLALFDDKVLGYLPPLAGPQAYHTIMESVYNVQSRWREANFGVVFGALQVRQVKRALVVVLSDIVDADTTGQFRRALASLATRHVVIFAALQTQLLGDIVRAPMDSMLDVCRKGVTMRLLREREKALHSLRHAGVHVLDVEPGQLTVPLLNQYIDLRERNLL